MEFAFCKVLNICAFVCVLLFQHIRVAGRHIRKELAWPCIFVVDFRYDEMTLWRNDEVLTIKNLNSV